MLFIRVKQWQTVFLPAAATGGSTCASGRQCFYLRQLQVAAPAPVADSVFTPLVKLKTLSYQGLWADRSDINRFAQNAVIPRVLSGSTFVSPGKVKGRLRNG